MFSTASLVRWIASLTLLTAAFCRVSASGFFYLCFWLIAVPSDAWPSPVGRVWPQAVLSGACVVTAIASIILHGVVQQADLDDAWTRLGFEYKQGFRVWAKALAPDIAVLLCYVFVAVWASKRRRGLPSLCSEEHVAPRSVWAVRVAPPLLCVACLAQPGFLALLYFLVSLWCLRHGLGTLVLSILATLSGVSVLALYTFQFADYVVNSDDEHSCTTSAGDSFLLRTFCAFGGELFAYDPWQWPFAAFYVWLVAQATLFAATAPLAAAGEDDIQDEEGSRNDREARVTAASSLSRPLLDDDSDTANTRDENDGSGESSGSEILRRGGTWRNPYFSWLVDTCRAWARGLCCTAALAWVLSFPSILAVPLVLWASFAAAAVSLRWPECCSVGNDGDSEDDSFFEVPSSRRTGGLHRPLKGGSADHRYESLMSTAGAIKTMPFGISRRDSAMSVPSSPTPGSRGDNSENDDNDAGGCGNDGASRRCFSPTLSLGIFTLFVYSAMLMTVEFVGFGLLRAGFVHPGDILDTSNDYGVAAWLVAIGLLPRFCTGNDLQRCLNLGILAFVLQAMLLTVVAFVAAVTGPRRYGYHGMARSRDSGAERAAGVCVPGVVSRNFDLIVLLVVFVCGLTRVDLIHSGYLLFFIVFLISIRLRLIMWRFLLAYSALVTTVLFFWQVLGSVCLGDGPLHEPSQHNATSLVGLLVSSEPTLWGTEFLFHVIILVVTALQMPLFAQRDYHDVARRSGTSAVGNDADVNSDDVSLSDTAQRSVSSRSRFRTPMVWVASVIDSAAAWLDRRVQHLLQAFDGMIFLIYITLLVVGFLPPVQLPRLADLLWFIAMLGSQLGQSPVPFAPSNRPLQRLLKLCGVCQGVEIFCKYAYQFLWVQDIVHALWDSVPGLEDSLTIQEIGLEVKRCRGELVLFLLPPVSLLFLTVLRLRYFHATSPTSAVLKHTSSRSSHSATDSYFSGPKDPTPFSTGDVDSRRQASQRSAAGADLRHVSVESSENRSRSAVGERCGLMRLWCWRLYEATILVTRHFMLHHLPLVSILVTASATAIVALGWVDFMGLIYMGLVFLAVLCYFCGVVDFPSVFWVCYCLPRAAIGVCGVCISTIRPCLRCCSRGAQDALEQIPGGSDAPKGGRRSRFSSGGRLGSTDSADVSWLLDTVTERAGAHPSRSAAAVPESQRPLSYSPEPIIPENADKLPASHEYFSKSTSASAGKRGKQRYPSFAHVRTDTGKRLIDLVQADLRPLHWDEDVERSQPPPPPRVLELMWGPLYYASAIMLLIKFTFQLSFATDMFNEDNANDTAWWGLYNAVPDDSDTMQTNDLWLLALPPLLVILSVTAQRLALATWPNSGVRAESLIAATRFVLDEDHNPGSGGEDTVSTESLSSRCFSLRFALDACYSFKVHRGVDDNVGPGFEVRYEFDLAVARFWVGARALLDRHSTRTLHSSALFALLVSAFVHLDVFSLLYGVMLLPGVWFSITDVNCVPEAAFSLGHGATPYPPASGLWWRIWISLVAVCIVFQYLLLLQLPPSLLMRVDPPWMDCSNGGSPSKLSPEESYFFFLAYVTPWATLSDVVALLLSLWAMYSATDAVSAPVMRKENDYDLLGAAFEGLGITASKSSRPGYCCCLRESGERGNTMLLQEWRHRFALSTVGRLRAAIRRGRTTSDARVDLVNEPDGAEITLGSVTKPAFSVGEQTQNGTVLVLCAASIKVVLILIFIFASATGSSTIGVGYCILAIWFLAAPSFLLPEPRRVKMNRGKEGVSNRESSAMLYGNESVASDFTQDTLGSIKWHGLNPRFGSSTLHRNSKPGIDQSSDTSGNEEKFSGQSSPTMIVNANPNDIGDSLPPPLTLDDGDLECGSSCTSESDVVYPNSNIGWFMAFRMYNVLALLAALFYQIPATSIPDPCVAGTKGCWSWQELWGLLKWEGVARTGYDYTNSTFFDADSPFDVDDFGSSEINSILVFALFLLQSAIFDLPAHTAVRRIYAMEDRASSIRRKYTDRLKRLTRSRKWVKILSLKWENAKRLRAVVHRVREWSRLRNYAQQTTRVELPTPPCERPVAQPKPGGSVIVRWKIDRDAAVRNEITGFRVLRQSSPARTLFGEFGNPVDVSLEQALSASRIRSSTDQQPHASTINGSEIELCAVEIIDLPVDEKIEFKVACINAAGISDAGEASRAVKMLPISDSEADSSLHSPRENKTSSTTQQHESCGHDSAREEIDEEVSSLSGTDERNNSNLKLNDWTLEVQDAFTVSASNIENAVGSFYTRLLEALELRLLKWTSPIMYPDARLRESMLRARRRWRRQQQHNSQANSVPPSSFPTSGTAKTLGTESRNVDGASSTLSLVHHQGNRQQNTDATSTLHTFDQTEAEMDALLLEIALRVKRDLQEARLAGGALGTDSDTTTKKENHDAPVITNAIAEEDEDKGEVVGWATLIVRAMRSNTSNLVYTAFLLNHLISGSLLSAPYALSVLLYAIPESPQPKFWFWVSFQWYTIALIIIKYMVELDVFCINWEMDSDDPSRVYTWPSVQPFCPEEYTAPNARDDLEVPFQFTWVYAGLIGLPKSTYDSGYSSTLGMDLLVLISILAHRSTLQVMGLWGSEESQASVGAGELLDFATAPRPSTPLQQHTRNETSKGSMRLATMELVSEGTLELIPSMNAKEQGVHEETEDGKRARTDESSSSCSHQGTCTRWLPRWLTDYFTRLVPPDPTNDPAFRELLSGFIAEDRHHSSATNAKRDGRRSSSEDASSIPADTTASKTLPQSGHEYDEEVRVEARRVALLLRTVQCDRYTNGKSGKELFLVTFVIQLFLLVYIIILYTEMASYPPGSQQEGVQDANVFAEIDNSQFSASTVLATLTMIAAMLVDRVAHLKRSLTSKVALHYTSVISVHVWAFIYVPIHYERAFINNLTLVLFYLIFLAYSICSALQIRHGYQSGFYGGFTRKGNDGPVQSLLFTLFRAIPFIYEMRAVLDWVCSSTSLDIFMFLKFEELRADLFGIRCQSAYRKRQRHILSGEEQQPFWLSKMLFGGSLFLLMVTCVVGPIVLFSSLNPGTTPNPIASTNSLPASSLVATLITPSATFEIFRAKTSNAPDLTEDEFVELQSSVGAAKIPPDYADIAQSVTMPPYSDTLWNLPAAGRIALINEVNSSLAVDTTAETNQIYVNFEWEFVRKNMIKGDQVSTFTNQIELTNENKARLCRSLVAVTFEGPLDEIDFIQSCGNVTAPQDSNKTFVAKNAYPKVLRFPSSTNAQPQRLQSTNDDLSASFYLCSALAQPLPGDASTLGDVCSITAPLVSGREYGAGAMRGVPPEVNPQQTYWVLLPDGGPSFDERGLNDGVKMYTVSDQLVALALLLVSSSYGVLGLYAFILVTVSSVVRSLLASPPSLIPYNEMVETDDLLELCEGICIARNEAYPGHLKDEVKLYWILISIYRSPETLLRITKEKVD